MTTKTISHFTQGIRFETEITRFDEFQKMIYQRIYRYYPNGVQATRLTRNYYEKNQVIKQPLIICGSAAKLQPARTAAGR